MQRRSWIRPLTWMGAFSLMLAFGVAGHAEPTFSYVEGANMIAELLPVMTEEDEPGPMSIGREGPFGCGPGSDPFDVKCGSVIDGCVEQGEDPLIFRFAIETRNVGYSMGYTPPLPPNTAVPECACTTPRPCTGSCCVDTYSNDDWVYSCTHGHYHLKDWGTYSLINNQTGLIVGSGVKYTFLVGFQLAAEEGHDVYGANLPCQFLKLSPDLAEGSYTLVQQVNAAHKVPEIREFDNASARRVSITRTGPESFEAISVPSVWQSAARNLQNGLGASTPSVITREVNSNDLFYVASNGHLHHKSKSSNGDWAPATGATQVSPADQPHPLVGGPAAVAMGEDRMEVFARDQGNRIRQASWTPASWSWANFGSDAGGAPAVASVSRDRALVAWVGTDGVLRSRGVPGVAISVPGAQFPTDQRPAMVATDIDAYHVFLRALDGTVKYNRYQWATSSWTGWVNLGGWVTGQLSAVSPYYRQAFVFGRQPTNRLVYLRVETDPANVHHDQSISWSAPLISPWTGNGALGLAGDPTAISTADKSLDVFFLQTDSSDGITYYRRRHLDITNSQSQFIGSDGSDIPPVWAFQWTSDPYKGFVLALGATPAPLKVSSWAARTFDLYIQQNSGKIFAHAFR